MRNKAGRAFAPINDGTGSLTRRPRRTLSHAQEKQRWRNGTVKSRFKRSGKRKRKNVPSGKASRTIVRRSLLEKILIWKGYSGGRSRPCINTGADAGRIRRPASLLRQDAQTDRRRGPREDAGSRAGETPPSALESTPSPPHPLKPASHLQRPAFGPDRRD